MSKDQLIAYAEPLRQPTTLCGSGYTIDLFLFDFNYSRYDLELLAILYPPIIPFIL